MARAQRTDVPGPNTWNDPALAPLAWPRRLVLEVMPRVREAYPHAEPDLAMSLGALGTVLMGLERHRDAAQAFAEGARVLLPHARTLPGAFAPLLTTLLRYYVQASKAAGHSPDEDLLGEVNAVLGQME